MARIVSTVVPMARASLRMLSPSRSVYEQIATVASSLRRVVARVTIASADPDGMVKMALPGGSTPR